jgi:predicted metal-dependent phosphoesterase TrpH
VFGLPFDQPGTFYRGNIHSHSTNSDGSLAPAALIAAYQAQGYDFLAITDHFLERYGCTVTDTREFRSSTFTTLLGAELHGPALENGSLWHIVSVGLPLDFEAADPQETGPELAERAVDAGAFVGIAHPAWNGVSPLDAQSIEVADAVEIFNTGHTSDSDRGNGWYLADLLATRGRRLSAFAADDAHFKERPDRFGGWVQVRAESLTPETLLASLKAGYYYSSQGPEIHDIRIDDDLITVNCSPAASINVGGRSSTCRYRNGTNLTEAEFPLAPFADAFFRITVRDAAGNRAWSNPIWPDVLG